MNNSAVINLTDSMLESDDLDATAADPTRQPDASASMERQEMPRVERNGEDPQSAFMDAVKTQMAETVWQTGKQQARKVFDVYGNIDLLRPYFDVEPKTVVHRLVLSLLPLRPSSTPQKAVGELYGPLMIVLTLVAILLMGMKDAGHTVREGTLMGSAIGISFGYWLLASGLFYGVSFICNTHITFLQVLSLTGYGMFSFCIVLFLGTTLHSAVSHTLFYTSWAILGGLSSLRMVGVYLSRTKGRSHKLTIALTVAALHLVFLLYLHFTYHKIVADVAPLHRPQVPPHDLVPKAPQNDAVLAPTQLDLPDRRGSSAEKVPLGGNKAADAAPNDILPQPNDGAIVAEDNMTGNKKPKPGLVIPVQKEKETNTGDSKNTNNF
ncbi:protein YIPF3-like isoform X2 [Acanthaster planci]|uniref:Protein YIPF3 n=1 Tax=Acanthaster planci TaxID=133434 RepID=A0A8B7YP28_ACAPL|nr:protein YIPF3-like isoform X2 [Acanthaster planci]